MAVPEYDFEPEVWIGFETLLLHENGVEFFGLTTPEIEGCFSRLPGVVVCFGDGAVPGLPGPGDAVVGGRGIFFPTVAVAKVVRAEGVVCEEANVSFPCGAVQARAHAFKHGLVALDPSVADYFPFEVIGLVGAVFLDIAFVGIDIMPSQCRRFVVAHHQYQRWIGIGLLEFLHPRRIGPIPPRFLPRRHRAKRT
ncbi:MAG TPA: hypothetical protein VFC46_05310 [Humisphaera sp.]|nr:hypothetical protein [Humisphaera sp.]